MYTLAPKAASLTPYDPITGDYPIRLDANESFLQPMPSDREAMAKAAANAALNRYPDPLATAPCTAFAKLYGVSPAFVTAGNGSDELILIILSTFLQKGEKVLTLSPDFSMYRFYTGITETPCIVLDKGADLRVDVDRVLETIAREQVRLCIFSNPCNPTSLGLPREEVRRLVRGTDALIVLDEAYMDFYDQSLLSEVEEYDNLIILRTCSKALGLAALRLGFAVCNERLTGILRAAKSPYNVNAVTQAMAAVALQNPAYRESYVEQILQSKRELYDGLRSLHRGKLFESDTNFVLWELPHAQVVFEELKKAGIVVRLFPGDRLRITAGAPAENAALLRELPEILNRVGE